MAHNATLEEAWLVFLILGMNVKYLLFLFGQLHP